jgi:hypothetical protein
LQAKRVEENDAGEMLAMSENDSNYADPGTGSGVDCWEAGKALEPGDVHAACLAAEDKLLCPSQQGRRAVDPSKSAPAPNDPLSLAENAIVNAKVKSYRYWSGYDYDLIVVPGFTPLDSTRAVRMHPDEKLRLTRAKTAYDDYLAPFIFVSGGAVYPAGTPCYEGVEMKHELIKMGVPSNRIIVDAAAQHSTTNIRNAGRYMLGQDPPLTRALIVTSGSQDFYFSNPLMSSFHFRSIKELGYLVGGLSDTWGRGRSIYSPGKQVKKTSKDTQDR